VAPSQWWLLFGLFFALTLVLEAPVYLVAFQTRPFKERIILWFCANATSYPPVFFLFPYLPISPLARELSAEVWAPLCEIGVASFLLGKITPRERGWIVVANLLSWLTGRLIVATVFGYAPWALFV